MNNSIYYKEILAIIMIKLLALGLIWAICFSHPVKKETRIENFKKIIYK